MSASITDQQLLDWNKLGLIPGPNEDNVQFTLRAAYCISLKSHIVEELEDFFPVPQEEISSEEVLTSALHTTHTFYDSFPQWIPLFFSDYQLSFWHGGSAWIFQQTENAPIAAFIQLRRHFKNADSYLGIYKRHELVVHELCHVGRMTFEEPKFEEIIAYHSSTSAWRRWIGPLIQSSYESAAFVVVLFLVLMLTLFSLFWEDPFLSQMALWGQLVPIGLIGLALGRLWSRKNQFSLCLKNLQAFVQDPHKARAILYRLTDQEIISFSHLSSDEIHFYAQQQDSLRWYVIRLAYLL